MVGVGLLLLDLGRDIVQALPSPLSHLPIHVLELREFALQVLLGRTRPCSRQRAPGAGPLSGPCRCSRPHQIQSPRPAYSCLLDEGLDVPIAALILSSSEFCWPPPASGAPGPLLMVKMIGPTLTTQRRTGKAMFFFRGRRRAVACTAPLRDVKAGRVHSLHDH